MCAAVALLGLVVCFAKKQHCYYKPEHIQPSQPLGNVGGGGAHGVAAPSASQKSPIGRCALEPYRRRRHLAAVDPPQP